ncbi:MAG: hypothetical protein IJV45_00635 [Prevotella sp.]|nr:hypothetical protein [Prevotella sp.]
MSIKNMEMAEAIANNQHIAVKKSFFGTKVIYQPSQSPVACDVYEYSQAEGDRMARLLRLPLSELAAELKAKGRPTPTAVGPMRLEVCRSKDGLFCAMQLFQFADFKYHALTELLACEDSEAQTLAQLVI